LANIKIVAMNDSLSAEVSVSIDAPASTVWKVITTPALIKKYLFDTNVASDWKEGSQITYEGEYQGKSYRDKGTILKIEPERVFQSTYWSSMGGKEDKPENYNLVTYTLANQGAKTLVTLTQDNILSEKEREYVIENWKVVLQQLKQVAEAG
jgi:uncharacterized protein YndB with AHSA1/START domain